MREVIAELCERTRRGETSALATVVATYHSAPRPAGAAMLRGGDDTVVGSVSGGCVEGAIFELGGEVIESGVPVLTRYGISNDDAFEVGLTCGGTLDVFVERITPDRLGELEEVRADLDAERPVAIATVIAHPDPARVGRRLVIRPDRVDGTLGSDFADAAVTQDTRGLLEAGTTTIATYGTEGERRGEGMQVFVASFAPRPRMIVFGAIDFAAAVAQQGMMIGYHVTVCDARPIFTTEARFPGVDELVVDWPHRYLAQQIEQGRIDERTVVCVLTHDPKFDVPVLQAAFGLPAGCYIGAMGSRRTHTDRVERLREAGATDDQIARIHSPIGLDLGARTPAETAVSIAAEIISTRWGGQGTRLSNTSGRIHERRFAPDLSEPDVSEMAGR